MKEMNLNDYEDEYGHKLSDVYAMYFRDAYCGDLIAGMCAEDDEPSRFEIIRRHEKELNRFRLDCDMGLLDVEIREAKEGEHWTVPVAEAFFEYLATRHVLSADEYGIDVTDMIHAVGTRLTDHDRFFARFLPESVATKDWIRFIASVYADIAQHIDVDDDFLDELLELNSEVIRYVPETKITMKRAVKAVCAQSYNIDYIPFQFRLECASEAIKALHGEYELQKMIIESLKDRLAAAA